MNPAQERSGVRILNSRRVPCARRASRLAQCCCKDNAQPHPRGEEYTVRLPSGQSTSESDASVGPLSTILEMQFSYSDCGLVFCFTGAWGILVKIYFIMVLLFLSGVVNVNDLGLVNWVGLRDPAAQSGGIAVGVCSTEEGTKTAKQEELARKEQALTLCN